MMSLMVWTGLHGLIGIGIAFATKGHTILGEVGTRTMRFRIVWGWLIPLTDSVPAVAEPKNHLLDSSRTRAPRMTA